MSSFVGISSRWIRQQLQFEQFDNSSLSVKIPMRFVLTIFHMFALWKPYKWGKGKIRQQSNRIRKHNYNFYEVFNKAYTDATTSTCISVVQSVFLPLRNCVVWDQQQSIISKCVYLCEFTQIAFYPLGKPRWMVNISVIVKLHFSSSLVRCNTSR